MGSYFEVKLPVTIKCPKCNENLDGWQSKGWEHEDVLLVGSADFNTLDNFYTTCKKCKEWVEFRLKQPLDLVDYEMRHGEDTDNYNWGSISKPY